MMNLPIRKCIYVAGPISDSHVIEMFSNLRIGIQESVDVLRAGYSPFSPFIDFQFALNRYVSIEEFYSYSLSQMLKQDGVYIIPNSFNTEGTIISRGVLNELEVACEHNMPIFYSIDEIKERFPLI